MKIVELDGYAANPDDISWEPLKALGELTVYSRTKAEDVVERAKDAEIVLTNKVVFTDEVMAQLPKLKYIGVLATGYNVIDVEAAHRRGIVVTNIPAYSTESVVQMTFAQILNITNQVGHYADEVRGKRWSNNPDFCYWDTPLIELSGKTMGIVGLGHIGSRVAHVAREFGMDVFALTSKDSSQLPDGIQKTTIDGLLGVADILTLHCPLTKDNYHMINAERLEQMKPGAILINTARGALVDEAAVAKALESGHLAAYGADVMDVEPPKADNPLLGQPHAFLTPHIAWATKEARTRLMNICVANVKAFIEGHPINRV
ncbi:MAG: D-2-hydroxyacid dehydrogenase [Prevotella sp.]|jgi:glycerate dehydrogenase|nr:D-2-hydroxyacid dehydrogenase [Prevotella sp.]MDY6240993.1 D-2-hydroxyacid dehydrogenase [Prevotella sp.]